MREIKFRAWNPEIKRMSKPFGFNHVMDFTNAEGLGYVKTITNEVLMQYTGLKDKNGKEIYEGDVLLVKDDYEGFGFAAGMRGVVIYDKGKFMCKGDIGKFFFEDNEMDYVEIIGNIYQNPELI